MTKYTVTTGGKSYEVVLNKRDGSTLSFSIDGTQHTVTVEAAVVRGDSPASTKLGTRSLQAVTATSHASPTSTALPGEVRAPIPGIVSDIKVKVGDVVSIGDTVAVIEAMKMENPIRSTYAGTVEIVEVAPGSEVRNGALLLKIK